MAASFWSRSAVFIAMLSRSLGGVVSMRCGARNKQTASASPSDTTWNDGQTGAPSAAGGWGRMGRARFASLLVVVGVVFPAQLPLLLERLQQAEHEHAQQSRDQHDLHRAQADASAPVHRSISLPRRAAVSSVSSPGPRDLSAHYTPSRRPLVGSVGHRMTPRSQPPACVPIHAPLEWQPHPHAMMRIASVVKPSYSRTLYAIPLLVGALGICSSAQVILVLLAFLPFDNPGKERTLDDLEILKDAVGLLGFAFFMLVWWLRWRAAARHNQRRQAAARGEGDAKLIDLMIFAHGDERLALPATLKQHLAWRSSLLWLIFGIVLGIIELCFGCAFLLDRTAPKPATPAILLAAQGLL